MPWEVMTMFETIERLYAKTGNTAIVDKAVKKGWITQDEGKRIVGE